MPTSLRISDSDLREATKAAIRYLMHRCDMSQKDIGIAIGYGDGQMVGKTLRDENMLASLPLVNLARLASKQGHDDLADLFSAPAKTIVASTAGEARPNLSLLEENAVVTMCWGESINAFRLADTDRAKRAVRRSFGACFDAMREIDALELARGDGAPTMLPHTPTI